MKDSNGNPMPTLKDIVEGRTEQMPDDMKTRVREFFNNQPGERSAKLARTLKTNIQKHKETMKPDTLKMYEDILVALEYAISAEIMVERVRRDYSNIKMLAKVYFESMQDYEQRLLKYESLEMMKAFNGVMDVAGSIHEFKSPLSIGM